MATRVVHEIHFFVQMKIGQAVFERYMYRYRATMIKCSSLLYNKLKLTKIIRLLVRKGQCKVK